MEVMRLLAQPVSCLWPCVTALLDGLSNLAHQTARSTSSAFRRRRRIRLKKQVRTYLCVFFE